MFSTLVSALWPFIGHMGTATLLMLVCAAWAVWGPIFKREAILVGVGIFLTTTAYVVGVTDGRHIVKTLWDAAIVRGITEAEKNRAKSDGTIRLDAPTRELCDDPANRNPC